MNPVGDLVLHVALTRETITDILVKFLITIFRRSWLSINF